MEIVSYHHPGT